MHCFFYGTLRDPDMREAVLGHPAAARPARLEGHALRRIDGTPYPAVVPAPGRGVAGDLVRLHGSDALRRLVAYEGADYRLSARLVRPAEGGVVRAHLFVARRGIRLAGTDWRLERWQATGKARLMAQLGGRRDPAGRLC